jgi:magnesium chelatase subunit D
VTGFPFDAVVGNDDAKLALRLAAGDPLIGGVLLRGEKGSAKTTLARGLAALLGDAPFVELPLGATEDRVVGTLDTRAALTGGEIRFHPGLLAAAHGGVLHVDEINLLADHLVDVLLDVAVSGVNVVERDGLSHRHPARFVLVGSMNPEEGELRPQLLDRFGLCVEVRAPRDVAGRVESVRRRLAFDAGDPAAGTAVVPGSAPGDRDGAAAVAPEVIELAARLALEVGAEGLRADLTMCRAAAALAALSGRPEAGPEDLRRVAPLVLAHRSRRGPFDPPVVPPERLQQAVDDVLGEGEEPAGGDDTSAAECDEPQQTMGGDRPLVLGAERRPPTPPQGSAQAGTGRFVRDAPAGAGDVVAAVPTVRAIAARRAADPTAAVAGDDLRTAVRAARPVRTVVLCVDLSGSMGAAERAAAASGTVLGLLSGAYEQRDRVALVTFRGDGAQLVLSPTSSVEVARNRLGELVTGGATPLAAGIREGLAVAERASGAGSAALLAVLTDGRANGDPDALDRALDAAAEVRRRGVTALVLDCETGPARLGLSATLAEAMGAPCIGVADLHPVTVTRAIRSRG